MKYTKTTILPYCIYSHSLQTSLKHYNSTLQFIYLNLMLLLYNILLFRTYFTYVNWRFSIFFSSNLNPMFSAVTLNKHFSRACQDLFSPFKINILQIKNDISPNSQNLSRYTRILCLYRYWWNTRIFPFTKQSYLHRAQWRYYFYLSHMKILVSSWLLRCLANNKPRKWSKKMCFTWKFH